MRNSIKNLFLVSSLLKTYSNDEDYSELSDVEKYYMDFVDNCLFHETENNL